MATSTTITISTLTSTAPALSPLPSSASKSPESALKSPVFHKHLATEPLFVKSAQGCCLHLEDGREILDGVAGAACVSVGHGEQRVIAAITKQLSQVAFTESGEFGTRIAEELAHELTSYVSPSAPTVRPFERVLFYSGGSEALESCIKLATQFHVENGEPARCHFVARKMSYHGNTLGALQLSHFMGRRTLFEPILNDTNFHHVSPCYPHRYKPSGQSIEDYVATLAQELERKFIEIGPGKVAAFFVEPVVGVASGVTADAPGYLQAVRDVCDKYGVLLCYDEVLCGMGRTGTLHAWEHSGVPADLQACGKSLSGGYAPMSCLLLSPRVVSVFERGSGTFVNHQSFQSWAVGAATAKAVMDVYRADGLVDKSQRAGAKLEALLNEHLAPLRHVGELDGRGLFWGVELVHDGSAPYKHDKHADARNVAANPYGIIESEGLALGPENVSQRVVNHMLQHSGATMYPCNGTIDGVRGNHLLVAPPLIITDDQLETLVLAAKKAIIAVLGE